ncbi:hypothetical protein QBC42DRAFT_165037, partial [Cladorrhinum samala]
MKTATLTLGLFAALTTAYSHPRYNLHLRRSNTTAIASSSSSAVESSTDSTLATGIADSSTSVLLSTGVAAEESSTSIILSTGVASAADPLITSAAPFPTNNGTGAGITTVTIATTSVRTITSCAPEVIDCPARTQDLSTFPSEALQTVVVTDTIVLTEVVCPVTAVPSISSSVLSEASRGLITGSTLTAPVASTTATAAASA